MPKKDSVYFLRDKSAKRAKQTAKRAKQTAKRAKQTATRKGGAFQFFRPEDLSGIQSAAQNLGRTMGGKIRRKTSDSQTASIVFPQAPRVKVEPLTVGPAKETVDITPLIPYDIDQDGLPTVESIRANPEILQRVPPQTRTLLINKLRARTDEEADVRQAQIAVPSQLVRLRQGTAQLQQAIEDLPQGLRVELVPAISELGKKIDDMEEKGEDEPPQYQLLRDEASRDLNITENVILERFHKQIGKRKLATFFNELFPPAEGQRNRSLANSIKILNKIGSKGLIRALERTEGRLDPEFEDLVRSTITQKQIEGRGLSPVRGKGKNIEKQFIQFMTLAKKKKLGKITDKQAKKLDDYSKLSGAGFFDSVWSGLKKAGETALDIGKKGVQIAIENPELAQKAFEMGKKLLKK